MTGALATLVAQIPTVTAAAAKTQKSSSSTILLLVVVAAGFYFLILRPQQQKAKRQREMVTQWEVGDEVLTSGGLIGHIIDIDDDRVFFLQALLSGPTPLTRLAPQLDASGAELR